MSDSNTQKMAFASGSLAIWANVALMLVYMFAFIYAAQNLGGDVSIIYWFLAVLAGIGVLATVASKVIVDVAWQMIRKKEELDKAKDKEYTRFIRTADKA